MKIKIHYSFYILLFLSVFSGLYKELLVMLISIGIHEGFHIVVGFLFKCKINSIIFTLVGGIVSIEIINLSIFKEIIVNISGVIANVLLIILAYYIDFGDYDKLIIEYNKLLILFNILPIYPLDGFRIIETLFKKSEKIKRTYNNLVIMSNVFLTILFIYAILNTSFGLLIISFFLLYKNITLIYMKNNIILRKIVENARLEWKK